MGDPKNDDAAIDGDDELIEDGQEEVFSRTAIEHGLVKDPPAIGPPLVDGEAEEGHRREPAAR